MSTRVFCSHHYPHQEVERFGKDYLEAVLRNQRDVPKRAVATWSDFGPGFYQLEFQWEGEQE